MMTKLPKFLIAKNILAKPDNDYVVHTRKPRFIAAIKKEKNKVSIYIVDQIDQPRSGEEMKKIITRLQDWYFFNYIKNIERYQ